MNVREGAEPVVWYFHPWELDDFRPDVDLGPMISLWFVRLDPKISSWIRQKRILDR